MEYSNEAISGLPMSKKLQSMVYVTFLLIGVGLLWPWNNILSATLFFQNNIFKETTIYAKVFTSSMMTVSTLSSLLFNIYLERRQHSYTTRVVRGLVWQAAAFILLTFVSSISSKLWLGLEFLLIMALISVSSIATAWTQNGIMAIANVFGPEYSQSVMMGQAVAGVLPSVVLFLVSIGKSDDPDTVQHNTGIYFYFLTTSLVSVACIWLFFRTQIGDKLREMTGGSSGTPGLEQDDQNTATDRIPFTALFAKLKFLALSIITTFIVTLIFPVFAATTFVSKLPLSNSEYIPLIFTVWNIGDLYGRFIANWSMFRSPDFTPYKTFLYAASRVLFIPFFFYYIVKTRGSNAAVNQSILTDLGYILLQFLFGLTNGHIISMSFMKVPESLATDQEKEAAGGFTSIFVSTGLAIGSVISYLFAFMISGITSR